MRTVTVKSLVPALVLLFASALTAPDARAAIANTFVLSDEGAGLITILKNGGYGNMNLYQTLIQIVVDTNPSVAGILTPTFLKALQGCPADSQFFTTHLGSISAGSSVAISDDCTLQVGMGTIANSGSLYGISYYGQPGILTLNSDISGVGRGLFTHPSDPAVPLTSWQANGNTYNVFAIGWAFRKLAFVQQPTNAKAYTKISPAVTVQLQDAGSNPVLQSAVSITLALASGNGTLSGMTAQTTDTSGLATFSDLSINEVGTKTLSASSSGLTSATSSSFVISTFVNINQDSFVLSNEAPGYLITRLIAAGYGDINLYETLLAVRADADPSVSGLLTDVFFNALALNPAGSPIFTTKLKDTLANGISVSISTDGSARYDNLEAKAFSGTFPTLQSNISGVGDVNFVHSTDPNHPLNSTVWQGPLPGMTTTYKAFAVAAGAGESIVATGGTPQSASISTPFAQPLQVTVTDALGSPVAGALVTFSAPNSGPSASLGSGGSATTDANGHASVTATANGIVGGPYLVTAATGTLPPVTFSLTNLPAAATEQIPGLDGIGLALFAALLAAGALKVLGRQ